ncbi:hypothetical protein SLEP1_g2522 [Rubroshorea leprosula]|uniref:Uncharacterized protein n=1 Tax=Rubroshorea leprosula TaxID=152421 RepID=A0AAV5HRZ5_9ROSI|nr:hypothetical protein SLEP1_g2522 [Rubroshorea leprosula]
MDDRNCCQPFVSCCLSCKRWGEKGQVGHTLVISERSKITIS